MSRRVMGGEVRRETRKGKGEMKVGGGGRGRAAKDVNVNAKRVGEGRPREW